METLDALSRWINSIKNLETDLKNSSRTVQDKDDRFEEAMGSFAADARDQFSILQAMATKMESLYAELAEYFVFDKQKYTLEEFFSDIKTFKDLFKQAYDSILKERESEAKLVRAREEREKAERERADRVAKKKALVDFNSEGNQEGVMDSLMEALKTGQAFSRDQKRKRAARPAGAERRAQLNRSRSKGRVGHSDNREIVDILLEEESETIQGFASNGGGRRRGRTSGASNAVQHREREFTGFTQNGGEVSEDDPDGLMRKLRAL